ncbi:Smr/MutS family protein, partial [Escherichia coli]|uniref:Smr/MutS family protein n=1 Tax=Escherichia coli TaxID=562 RepID=UPI003EE10E67
MCQKHTWEINMLGRRVMPIMHEISHLPGGHKPLNFVHKLADGLRNVLIIHGKGRDDKSHANIVRSYVARWLTEFDDVQAY